MKITMLGTGSAFVTKCYNTCFVLTADDGRQLLVDGGGGNALLQQLEKTNIDWRNLRQIFVTHKHIDHLLGIVWMIRLICQRSYAGQYEGEAYLYANENVVNILLQMAKDVLAEKHFGQIGKVLHFITLHDGDVHDIAGNRTTFFDIQSTKAPQFGFSMEYAGNANFLVCLGDEPYKSVCQKYVENASWLMHEAFCLKSEAERYKPYEKCHSTMVDACEVAEKFKVKNLIVYHTEEKHLAERKELYTAEGRPFYAGNIFVPNDLEEIEL